ncbi:dihydrofolate reductase family protein [Fodinicola acaciae]|uniref:dihydrofolate reductase family protein n=1 Tax=Fodinicola acaciae TaxID=2681555 RepID=UPI0013D504A2|nr:dihydrofolate reductase family protein [Fodinicola acaciae]
MARVIAQASMSVDGFVAGPGETGFEHLFDWCVNGDVQIQPADVERAYHVSAASADYVLDMLDGLGAIVVGRRQYDVMNGWNGRHPSGLPVFVVTHTPPATAGPGFAFVTGGIAESVQRARNAAGNRDVGIGPGSVVGQALDARLVDELRVDLAPVLLGDGVRLTGPLASAPVVLGMPRVIEGKNVTHLAYPVSYQEDRP